MIGIIPVQAGEQLRILVKKVPVDQRPRMPGIAVFHFQRFRIDVSQEQRTEHLVLRIVTDQAVQFLHQFTDRNLAAGTGMNKGTDRKHQQRGCRALVRHIADYVLELAVLHPETIDVAAHLAGRPEHGMRIEKGILGKDRRHCFLLQIACLVELVFSQALAFKDTFHDRNDPEPRDSQQQQEKEDQHHDKVFRCLLAITENIIIVVDADQFQGTCREGMDDDEAAVAPDVRQPAGTRFVKLLDLLHLQGTPRGKRRRDDFTFLVPHHIGILSLFVLHA